MIESIFGTAEVDCEEVFGGEPLERQAVMATDDDGLVMFGLELADADCHLAPRSVLELLPTNETAFQIDLGVLICTFFGGVDSVEIKAGESVATTQIEQRTVKAMFIVEGDGTKVIVIEGLLTVDPADLACRSVVGPTEEIHIDADGSLTIHQLDPGLIPDSWRTSFGLTDTMLSPEPGPELLPGLRELIDNDQVTVLFDGGIVAEAETTDVSQILESVTASRVVLEPDGQITIAEEFDSATLPTFAFPLESPAIDPAIDPSIVADIDPGVLGDALDQGAAVEPAVTEWFIDPDGHRWSLAYDAADPALEAELVSTLNDQIFSGAYGAFYRGEFGVGPDYDIMFPDLMEGSDSCRS
jgi:hypothetical protein